MNHLEGILPVNKSKNKTSFSLVYELRKKTKIQKIGHGGTLDFFADGVMVMFLGRAFTRFSSFLLQGDKEYLARIFLGSSSDTFDCVGKIQIKSSYIPSKEEILEHLKKYQGKISQIPPMYSAKKVNGQKLLHLARKGKEIERKPCLIELKTTLLSYSYPFLDIHVACSKGTYIRSIANDLGEDLKTGAYLFSLTRLRAGPFELKDCIDQNVLQDDSFNLSNHLIRQWTYTKV